jgi:hypothetical protein
MTHNLFLFIKQKVLNGAFGLKANNNKMDNEDSRNYIQKHGWYIFFLVALVCYLRENCEFDVYFYSPRTQNAAAGAFETHNSEYTK